MDKKTIRITGAQCSFSVGSIQENKETIQVPVMYASPERWVSIQKQGFMRDKRQQLIVPAIIFKRTSIEKNETI